MRPVIWLDRDGRHYMVAIPGRRWQRVWRWQVRRAVMTKDGPAMSALLVHQRGRRVRGYTGWAIGWHLAMWRAERGLRRALANGDG